MLENGTQLLASVELLFKPQKRRQTYFSRDLIDLNCIYFLTKMNLEKKLPNNKFIGGSMFGFSGKFAFLFIYL